MSAAEVLPSSPAITAASRGTSHVSAARPQLAVRFASDRTGRTYLSEQHATHPYHLCRALYRGDDPPGLCTLYSQGCSGGLFEDDRVRANFTVDSAAQAHVTTGAATIVHRMPGLGWAEQHVSVDVAAAALFELIPDPLILFPRSRLKNRLTLRIAGRARALLVDSFLIHQLPGDDRPFAYLDSETRVEDGSGRLLARDRSHATGVALAQEGRGRWRGQATVMALGDGAELLVRLREAVVTAPAVYAGASALPEDVGVVVRMLAADAVALRAGVRACWAAARTAFGLPVGQPRPK